MQAAAMFGASETLWMVKVPVGVRISMINPLFLLTSFFI
jgi:hypothetical protein